MRKKRETCLRNRGADLVSRDLYWTLVRGMSSAASTRAMDVEERGQEANVHDEDSSMEAPPGLETK